MYKREQVRAGKAALRDDWTPPAWGQLCWSNLVESIGEYLLPAVFLLWFPRGMW